jgi:hypothetical protein
VLDDSSPDSGAVFVFVRAGLGWTTNAYVKPSNTGPGDRFGSAVALSLHTLVVGAPFEDSGAFGPNGVQLDESRTDSGAAFGFAIVDHPAPAAFCFGDGSGPVCPCANSGATGSGCANGTLASGARLEASGFAGIAPSTDTLVLTASGVTGLSILAQGSPSYGWSGTGLGDGVLCLSGQLMFIGTAQPTGTSVSIPNPAAPAQLHVAGLVTQAGIARAYQVIYRDASAFCTPAVMNTTTALVVTWGL